MAFQKSQAMTSTNEALIQEITQTIADAVNPQKIILFGSYARGMADLNSDLDLLIVTNQSFVAGHSRRHEMARLWRLLARFAIPKDILIYSRDEVEHWRHTRNHIIARAFREGKILYERT